VRWLIETPSVSGLFNVGTGIARSFRDLASAMFRALGRAPDIEFVDMPSTIRERYQYFTESKVEKLRRAGYNGGCIPLEDAVALYVGRFLDQPDCYR
jgi:ADP-L-glycero-D-manno-heptose 6-epimerase